MYKAMLLLVYIDVRGIFEGKPSLHWIICQNKNILKEFRLTDVPEPIGHTKYLLHNIIYHCQFLTRVTLHIKEYKYKLDATSLKTAIYYPFHHMMDSFHTCNTQN